MCDTLHIDELYNALGDRVQVTSDEIADFYWRFSPDIPISTIRWKIHSLVNRGVIYSIGRGLYRFGRKPIFKPNIYSKTKVIADIMRRRLPFAKYCQWDLHVANAFSTFLLNTQLYFVDVERDVVNVAYHEILKTYRRTVLYRNLYEELPYYNGYIVVRNMALDAPTVDVEEIPMASLEKILVDFVLDRAFPFSDSEIVDIYANATADYSVRTNRMLRYACRRGRRDVIEEILNEINYKPLNHDYTTLIHSRLDMPGIKKI